MPPLKVHKMKRGDLRPFVHGAVGDVDEDGEIILGSQPLTGATVVFNMKDETGTLIVDRGPCVIDDALLGKVHYEWQLGDTAVAGDFVGEFEATISGKPMSFPNDSNLKIKIFEDLG